MRCGAEHQLMRRRRRLGRRGDGRGTAGQLEDGCFAVVYEASGGAEEGRSAPPRLVDTTASFSSTGPPNPNPTRARRTPRHTRRD